MAKKKRKISKRPALWTAQNFIRDCKLVTKLLSFTDIGANDLVVEIGAGRGVITEELIKVARRVIALEVDEGLVRALKQKLAPESNLQVIATDFLRWQLPKEPYKIFANIPFNQTADIIRRLTDDDSHLVAAYLIVQDKAAWRFSGAKGNTQISILLEPWYDIKVLTPIKRFEFTPIPKVDVVLLQIATRKTPLIANENRKHYCDFISYGFNQWQPTVAKAYRKVFTADQISQLNRELKLTKLKPTQLSPENWRKLFDYYLHLASPPKQQLILGFAQKIKNKHQHHSKLYRTRD